MISNLRMVVTANRCIPHTQYKSSNLARRRRQKEKDNERRRACDRCTVVKLRIHLFASRDAIDPEVPFYFVSFKDCEL